MLRIQHNLCGHPMQQGHPPTDGQEGVLRRSQPQASQEATPSLTGTQWSAPSRPPVSFVGSAAVGTGPPPLPIPLFKSSEDAVSLIASDDGDIADHKNEASSLSPPRPEGARPQDIPGSQAPCSG